MACYTKKNVYEGPKQEGGDKQETEAELAFSYPTSLRPTPFTVCRKSYRFNIDDIASLIPYFLRPDFTWPRRMQPSICTTPEVPSTPGKLRRRV